MSNMLASDLANPDFAGRENPDSKLAVIFYSKSIPQEYLSTQEGRPIFRDTDYVKIFVPGDNTTVIDTPVREEHKARFPIQWAHYQNKHGGDAREIGTPLTQWSRLTPSQCEELRALKFFTVENVAGASDSQLQSIGMAAGMDPHAFRDAARRFLAVAKDDSTAAAAEAKAKALEEENAKLKAETEAKLAAMKKEMEDSMAEKIAAAVAAAVAPKKRGRPAKVA